LAGSNYSIYKTFFFTFIWRSNFLSI